MRPFDTTVETQGGERVAVFMFFDLNNLISHWAPNISEEPSQANLKWRFLNASFGCISNPKLHEPLSETTRMYTTVAFLFR